eukprot:1629746-Rhodomonas_salina.1
MSDRRVANDLRLPLVLVQLFVPQIRLAALRLGQQDPTQRRGEDVCAFNAPCQHRAWDRSALHLG